MFRNDDYFKPHNYLLNFSMTLYQIWRDIASYNKAYEITVSRTKVWIACRTDSTR